MTTMTTSELGINNATVSPENELRITPFLHAMVKQGASDLYLTTGANASLKIRGKLRAITRDRMKPGKVRQLAEELLTATELEAFFSSRELNKGLSLKGIGRFRMNFYFQRGEVSMVIRHIRSDIRSPEELKLPDVLKQLVMRKEGMILFVGSTGSGKSTSMASLIQYRNERHSGHILTIEDPIEFVHPSKKCLVNQREIGPHSKSFATALRAALREDPDIVLVGEMRDLETIQLALTAAETGHLVFGTLHTSSAPKTVDRIIDVFPPAQQAQVRAMFSESIQAIITQTLCKKVGGGRVAALEILMGTTAVRNLIREGKIHQIPGVMQTSQNVGMQTLEMHLRELVDKGLITRETAIEKTSNPTMFDEVDAARQAGKK